MLAMKQNLTLACWQFWFLISGRTGFLNGDSSPPFPPLFFTTILYIYVEPPRLVLHLRMTSETCLCACVPYNMKPRQRA